MHVSINEIEFCVLKLQHKKDVHNKFHENSLSSSCLSKHLIKNVYSALDGFFPKCFHIFALFEYCVKHDNCGLKQIKDCFSAHLVINMQISF